MANINVTQPRKCPYLASAPQREMSYYRKKSLQRAVSYRATLVKRDGTLASTQYSDQYVDAGVARAAVKRALSAKLAASQRGDGASSNRCCTRESDGFAQIAPPFKRSESATLAPVGAEAASGGLNAVQDGRRAINDIDRSRCWPWPCDQSNHDSQQNGEGGLLQLARTSGVRALAAAPIAAQVLLPGATRQGPYPATSSKWPCRHVLPHARSSDRGLAELAHRERSRRPELEEACPSFDDL